MVQTFRINFFISSLFILIAFVSSTTAQQTIATCQELQDIENNLRGNYVLANHINCNGFNFRPIGSKGGIAAAFSGTLDGAYHTISNLTISEPLLDYVGLFQNLDGANIRQLTLNNINMTGVQYVGGLSAIGTSTIISDVKVQGSLLSTGDFSQASCNGGLIGWIALSTIQHSSTSINIITKEKNSTYYPSNGGGLVGCLSTSTRISHTFTIGEIKGPKTARIGGLIGSTATGDITISDSSSSAAVTGGIVGGLIGENLANVTRCYSDGKVVGIGDSNSSASGGLVGKFSDKDSRVPNTIIISDSYSLSSVSGNVGGTGGLIGAINCWNANTVPLCFIKRTYAAGFVSGNSNNRTLVGGLVGADQHVQSQISDSYWDLRTTNQFQSQGGIGLVTARMHLESTYENWDFVNVWAIVNRQTYPWLRDVSK